MGKFIDLTGKKFGNLTVICRTESKQRNTMWKCQCDCGNEKIVNGYFLKKGTVKSCGCAKRKDISGKRYGKLVAIKPVGYKNGYIWECRCDCGNKTNVSLANLNSGHIRSCGCINKGIIRNFKHGLGNKRIYREYFSMVERCKKDWKRHEDYYDRGITICQEWLGEQGLLNFVNWAENNGYNENLTLDRINNDKGYHPDNCRWATVKQQANNRRSNIKIEYNGETKTLMEWCEFYNLKYGTIKARIERGWNIERAFLEPIQHSNRWK